MGNRGQATPFQIDVHILAKVREFRHKFLKKNDKSSLLVYHRSQGLTRTINPRTCIRAAILAFARLEVGSHKVEKVLFHLLEALKQTLNGRSLLPGMIYVFTEKLKMSS